PGFGVENGDDFLALLPLLDLDRARVPDLHRAPAVFSRGDLTGETRVFPRVVLGLHGEPVLFHIQRRLFGYGPRGESPAPLAAEAPVQPARVVALDHEDRLISSWGLTALEWFGGALGVAFRAVGRKRGVARSVLVLPVIVFAAAVIRAGPRGATAPSAPPGWRGGERLHRVDSVLDPLQHLPVGQLLQARLLQFFPGPGRGDHRPRPTPQRERADRCLRRVVLTPIDEHLAPPQL